MNTLSWPVRCSLSPCSDVLHPHPTTSFFSCSCACRVHVKCAVWPPSSTSFDFKHSIRGIRTHYQVAAATTTPSFAWYTTTAKMQSAKDMTQWLLEMKSRYRGPVMEGAFKGFILYLVPVAVLSRRLNNDMLRRATAVAAFASVTRALHRILLDRQHAHDELLRAEVSSPRSPSATLTSDEQQQQQQQQQQRQSVPGKVVRRSRSQSVGNGVQVLQEICKDLLDVGARFPRFFAAAVGTIAALMIDSGFVSSIFVLWCAIRAIRCSIPSQYTFRGAPALVMVLASAQVRSCRHKPRQTPPPPPPPPVLLISVYRS
jgi:hypothetical protein